MKQLNLGIDFDGVITDPTQIKINWIKKNCGVELSPNQTVKNVAVPIIGKEAYKAMIKDCYAGDLALENRIREEAMVALRTLLEQGHKAYIITSRMDDELEKALKLIEIHRVPCTAVHNTREQPKDEICRKLGIHIFLDDGQEKLAELQTIPGIQLVFFNVFSEKLEYNFYEVVDWSGFLTFVEEKSHENNEF